MKTQNISHSKENLDALAQRCRELEGRADALSQELQATLGDWNALVRAIQSPTHGGAVAHAAGVVRERDALRAEVERLTLHVVKAQQHALDMENKAFELAAREVEFFVEVEQLRQDAARYERLRRLNPRQFAEIHQRNLAGERFDDLVDAL